MFFLQSNILLTKEKYAKLADFGLSRILDSDNNQSLTANIGSLPYISPECRTRSKYNNKTDIWFYLLLLILN